MFYLIGLVLKMYVTLNGTKTYISDNSSVRDLVIIMNVENMKFAIAVNQCVVPKSLHDTTFLFDGDVVDFIVPMQGG